MTEVNIGDIWRIFYWKNPDDYNGGVKCFHYLIMDYERIYPEGYKAVELETDIDCFIDECQFNSETRYKLPITNEYVIFTEKLA